MKFPGLIYDNNGNEVWVFDQAQFDSYMNMELRPGVLRHTTEKPPQKFSDEYMDLQAVQRHARRVVQRFKIIARKHGLTAEQTTKGAAIVRGKILEDGPKTRTEIKDPINRRDLNAHCFDECYSVVREIRAAVGDVE